jgi:hypothetical protein
LRTSDKCFVLSLFPFLSLLLLFSYLPPQPFTHYTPQPERSSYPFSYFRLSTLRHPHKTKRWWNKQRLKRKMTIIFKYFVEWLLGRILKCQEETKEWIQNEITVVFQLLNYQERGSAMMECVIDIDLATCKWIDSFVQLIWLLYSQMCKWSVKKINSPFTCPNLTN